MIVAPFRVVLDANVLFPFTLRDTLLRAAEAGIYQMYWSAEILEETRRSLVRAGKTTDEQSERLVATMRAAFPESLVTGYEALTASMTNDTDDRHVVAAAVKAGAQVIVTNNVKDFEPLPDGIEAQTPDVFLCNLFDLDPDAFVERLREQAAGMKKRTVTLEQLVAALAKVVPEFAAAATAHAQPSTAGHREPSK